MDSDPLTEGTLTEIETLRGDLRDALLDRLKRAEKPWEQMAEDEQRAVIDDIDALAANLIRDTVRLIAQNGRTTLQATLEQVTVKDGIKAVLALSRHDAARLDLVDSVGKLVLVVVADAQEFMGMKDEARPDNLREPGLPLEQNDDGPIFDRTRAGAEAA